MPLQFDDNFPIILSDALEFAKPFLNEEDYRTFLDYSGTEISEESKEELIKILHDLWAQRKTMGIPDTFSNNQSQPNPNNYQQPDTFDRGFVPTSNQSSNQPAPQFNTNFNNPKNAQNFMPNNYQNSMQNNVPVPQFNNPMQAQGQFGQQNNGQMQPRPMPMNNGSTMQNNMQQPMRAPAPQFNNQGQMQNVQQNQFQGQFQGQPQGQAQGQMQSQMQGQFQGQMQPNMQQSTQAMQAPIQPQPSYTINPTLAPVSEVETEEIAPTPTNNRAPKPEPVSKPKFDPSQFNFGDLGGEEDDDEIDYDFDDEDTMDNNEDSKLSADTLVEGSKYKPSSILDKEDDEENEFSKIEKSLGKKKLEPQEPETHNFEFDDTEETAPIDTKKNLDSNELLSENDSKHSKHHEDKKTIIDFGSIRNNVRKNELQKATQTFTDARDNQEKSFKELIEKQTLILSEFEDINDYVEAMTDTILNLNDQMKTRAQDIQDLRNLTDIKGPSAQSQLDELGYTLDQIKKEIRSVKVESERGLKELLSRVAVLEANSYRGDSDIDARVALLQSKLSQMNGSEKTIKSSPNGEVSSKQDKLNKLQSIK